MNLISVKENSNNECDGTSVMASGDLPAKLSFVISENLGQTYIHLRKFGRACIRKTVSNTASGWSGFLLVTPRFKGFNLIGYCISETFGLYAC